MKVTHHTLQASGRMSVNCQGSVPSAVVATVTWHVVGLHGGEHKACPLAVEACRTGSAKATGNNNNNARARALKGLQ